MKKCISCKWLIPISDNSIDEDWYQCSAIGNCDLTKNVTTMDDEGGQYAVLLIKDPSLFGCIYQKES